MSEIDVLSLARKHGLIPEGELPKFPVERFIDYPGRLEELQAFADEVAKLVAAEAQALLKGKDDVLLWCAEVYDRQDVKKAAEYNFNNVYDSYLAAIQRACNKSLAQTSGTDALDKMLNESFKDGANTASVDLSDAEITKAYREGMQEGYDKCWNEFADMEAVAYGDRLSTHLQSAWCIPSTGVPPWMETTTPLIPRPERKS